MSVTDRRIVVNPAGEIVEPVDWIRVPRAPIWRGDAGLVKRIDIWARMQLELGRWVTWRHAWLAGLFVYEAWAP